jgi:hypothetical protein
MLTERGGDGEVDEAATSVVRRWRPPARRGRSAPGLRTAGPGRWPGNGGCAGLGAPTSWAWRSRRRQTQGRVDPGAGAQSGPVPAGSAAVLVSGKVAGDARDDGVARPREELSPGAVAARDPATARWSGDDLCAQDGG